MTYEDVIMSFEVRDRFKELLKFFIKKNKEENLRMTKADIQKVAHVRACSEVYVEFCREGKIEKPVCCDKCVCAARLPYKETDGEEFLCCTMAPPETGDDINLKCAPIPEYCPIYKKTIKQYVDATGGPAS